jgi:hypothetical protein
MYSHGEFVALLWLSAYYLLCCAHFFLRNDVEPLGGCRIAYIAEYVVLCMPISEQLGARTFASIPQFGLKGRYCNTYTVNYLMCICS